RHQQGENDDNQALRETKREECRLEAVSGDPPLDGCDGECRAGTKSGCSDAGGKTAFVREPFEGITNASAIHAACADTRQDLADIELRQCFRVGVYDPADGAKNAAEDNHTLRAVLVDEPGFNGNQPGLEKHEQREGPLDRRSIPAEFRLNVWDKECPAV